MSYIAAAMQIDPARPVPIYLQLKTLLVDADPRAPVPDDRLPTEHELCEMHGISRTPVNRALSELAAEGLILRHRRRGSFVNPHWLGRRHGDSETPRRRARLRPVGAADPRRRRRRAAQHRPRPRATSLHRVLDATPSPRARRPTSPSSITSGRPSSPPPASSIRSRTSTRMGAARARRRLPRRARRGRPLRGPDVRGARRSPRSRGSGTASASCEPSGSMRRRRGGSCSPGAGAPAGPPGDTAAGDAGRHRRRRDDHLLPHRAARLERRQRDRRRWHRHRVPASAQILRFLRRLVTDGCLPPAAVGYQWDRPIHLLADGQAVITIGGTYEAETLAHAPAPGSQASGTTSASRRSRPDRRASSPASPGR